MSQRSSADEGVEQGRASPPFEPGLEGEAGALAAESIGRYLSQQRRLRGISIAQLAELTRIPVRSIERLEAGHFDDDIDGFVRGFVRTVSEALGLDPEDALARMLSEPRGEPEGARPLGLLLARSLVGLCVVALIALGIGLVRSAVRDDATTSAGVPAAPVVWRNDPVRALAEANAAARRDVAEDAVGAAAASTRR
jgi:hypothetical protein